MAVVDPDLLRLLRQELEMLRLETDIQEKTRSAIDQNNKDYYDGNCFQYHPI